LDFESPEYWDMLLRRSLSRFFVLLALSKQPLHGYALKEEVRRVCGGCCEPSDAMIYPTLNWLLEHGYVACATQAQGGRERKVCTLTPRGMRAFKAASQVWEAVLPHITEGVKAANALQIPEEKPEEVVAR